MMIFHNHLSFERSMKRSKNQSEMAVGLLRDHACVNIQYCIVLQCSRSPAILVFLPIFSLNFLVVCTCIFTWKISELRKKILECQHRKFCRHKFKSAMNVLFYYYFCVTFSSILLFNV